MSRDLASASHAVGHPKKGIAGVNALTSLARCAPAAALLAALSVPVLFWRLGDHEVTGILEARVAITAREMWRSGEWILPTMNGEFRLQKPPLTYWLPMVAASARGTFDEWTLRLPFAVLGVATLFFAWRTASLRGGSRHGLLCALVLLSSPLFMKEFRLAAADPALCFAVVGAWWCQAEGRARMRPHAGVSGPGRLPTLGFWFFTAIGAIAKGPVVLAWVLLPALVEAAVTRSRAPLRALWSGTGLTLFLVLSLAWPALVTDVVGVKVVWQWFLESFGKVLPSDGVENGYAYQRHSESWHYYLARLSGYFGFWTVALPIALWRLAQGLRERSKASSGSERIGDRPDAAPLFQLSVMLGFFSLVEEKKSAYVLPLLVSGAILAAGELAATDPRLLKWLKRCAVVGASVAAGAAVILCLAPAAALPSWAPAGAASGLWVGMLGTGMAAGIVMARIPAAADSRLPFVAVAVGLALGTPPYLELRRLRVPDEMPMKAEALATRAFLTAGEPLFAAGDLPRDLLFYLDTEVCFIHREVEGVLALDAERLARLRSGDKVLIASSLLTPEIAAPQDDAGRAALEVERIRLAHLLAGFRPLKSIYPSTRRHRDRAVLFLKE